jgi:hypothetical protein
MAGPLVLEDSGVDGLERCIVRVVVGDDIGQYMVDFPAQVFPLLGDEGREDPEFGDALGNCPKHIPGQTFSPSICAERQPNAIRHLVPVNLGCDVGLAASKAAENNDRRGRNDC